MNQVGFDSEKYIRLQSEHIRERINQFGGKFHYNHMVSRSIYRVKFFLPRITHNAGCILKIVKSVL